MSGSQEKLNLWNEMTKTILDLKTQVSKEIKCFEEKSRSNEDRVEYLSSPVKTLMSESLINRLDCGEG